MDPAQGEDDVDCDAGDVHRAVLWVSVRLVLYWFVSNLLAIAHQFWMNRSK